MNNLPKRLKTIIINIILYAEPLIKEEGKTRVYYMENLPEFYGRYMHLWDHNFSRYCPCSYSKKKCIQSREEILKNILEDD